MNVEESSHYNSELVSDRSRHPEIPFGTSKSLNTSLLYTNFRYHQRQTLSPSLSEGFDHSTKTNFRGKTYKNPDTTNGRLWTQVPDCSGLYDIEDYGCFRNESDRITKGLEQRTPSLPRLIFFYLETFRESLRRCLEPLNLVTGWILDCCLERGTTT